MELLNAFDVARKETEEFQRNEKRRQEERQRLITSSRKRMKGSAHEDNIEEDVADIWEQIKQYGAQQLSLTDICDPKDRVDVIRTLISVLFLAYENKIKYIKENFHMEKYLLKQLVVHKEKIMVVMMWMILSKNR